MSSPATASLQSRVPITLVDVDRQHSERCAEVARDVDDAAEERDSEQQDRHVRFDRRDGDGHRRERRGARE
jgi:hypothetical protein